MRPDSFPALLVLCAASTTLLFGACARSNPPSEVAASSPEVTISAPPTYAASRQGGGDQIDTGRLDRAPSAELARRARLEARAAAPSRPASEPAPAATVSRLEPAPGGAQGDPDVPTELIPTDRFRAIPMDWPSESEPTEHEPTRVRTTERFREVRLLVAAGTTLEVEVERDLSSQTSEVGEVFGARVVTPVSVDGYFAIPVGAEVVGHVEEVEPARRLGGRARLVLIFDRLLLPTAEVPLGASLYDEARGEGKRDAATIGGATIAGAILGRAIGDENRTRGGTLGALIGAAIGTGIATAKEGEPIELPAGTRLLLELDEAVEVVVRIRVLEAS